MTVATPAEDLARARAAYEQNDWAGAVQLLRPLLYPKITLSSPDEVDRARKLLGAAYFYAKDNFRARLEFQMLLTSQPDFRMDRVVDGPDVTDFVERLRRENADELRRIEDAQRRAEDKRKKEEADRIKNALTIVREERIREHPFAVNLLPFGAGQFQNKQSGKGWGFLVTEAALGAASIATYASVRLKYPTGVVPEKDAGTAASLELTHIVTGGLFFVVWGLGVYDAIENWKPEEVTSPGRPPPAPAPRVSIRPTPTGLGITF